MVIMWLPAGVRFPGKSSLLKAAVPGGYVGAMHSGVITNGQAKEVKQVSAMRTAGRYAGEAERRCRIVRERKYPGIKFKFGTDDQSRRGVCANDQEFVCPGIPIRSDGSRNRR